MGGVMNAPKCFMEEPEYMTPSMQSQPCTSPVDGTVRYSLGSEQEVAHATCIKHGSFLARSVLTYARDKKLPCKVTIELGSPEPPERPQEAPNGAKQGRSKPNATQSTGKPRKAPESRATRTR